MKEILLIDLDGFRCALWRAKLDEYREIPHATPLGSSDFHVATMIDGDIQYLVDFALCLGLETAAEGREYALLCKVEDVGAGLWFRGAASPRSVDESLTEDFPAHFRNSIIKQAVSLDGALVPVIEPRGLMTACGSKSKSSFSINAKRNQSPAALSGRFVTYGAGAYTFAADAASFAAAEAPLAVINRLPLVPGYVAGFSLIGETILPVVNLAEGLGIVSSEEEPLTAISDVDPHLAVRVSQVNDVETEPKIVNLPTLFSYPWSTEGLATGSVLAPIIDYRTLVYHLNRKTAPKGPNFTLNSSFTKSLFTDPVEIVEIQISGSTYAIPAEEAGKVVKSPRYTPLPTKRQISPGVLIGEDDELPVVDLPSYFGVNLRTQGEGVFISNGTFSGCVLAEKVTPKRIIPVSAQRVLPVTLPHPVVYGCYIEDDEIRLILNIASIVIYSNNAEIRQALGVYAPPGADIQGTLLPQAAPAARSADPNEADAAAPAAPGEPPAAQSADSDEVEAAAPAAPDEPPAARSADPDEVDATATAAPDEPPAARSADLNEVDAAAPVAPDEPPAAQSADPDEVDAAAPAAPGEPPAARSADPNEADAAAPAALDETPAAQSADLNEVDAAAPAAPGEPPAARSADPNEADAAAPAALDEAPAAQSADSDEVEAAAPAALDETPAAQSADLNEVDAAAPAAPDEELPLSGLNEGPGEIDDVVIVELKDEELPGGAPVEILADGDIAPDYQESSEVTPDTEFKTEIHAGPGKLVGSVESEPARSPEISVAASSANHRKSNKGKFLLLAAAIVILAVAAYVIFPRFTVDNIQSTPGQIVSPPTAPADENPVLQGSSVLPATFIVFFEADSDVIPPGAGDIFAQIRELATAAKDINIEITGHTARFGTEESCIALSQLRANAVRERIMDSGIIEPNSIISRGAGTSELIIDDLESSEVYQNRRVEIVVSK